MTVNFQNGVCISGDTEHREFISGTMEFPSHFDIPPEWAAKIPPGRHRLRVDGEASRTYATIRLRRTLRSGIVRLYLCDHKIERKKEEVY